MAGYVPNTKLQQKEMLAEIGLDRIDGLFADLPQDLLLNRLLDIPGPLSEIELDRHMRSIAAKNANSDSHLCFLGAGAYDHYIPAVVGQIVSRQEFYTSYTPYQPEISQGTLQAIFEYQTMICELTGMDCSNASLYDCATALAEAAMLARRATGRSRVILPKSVHPEYRETLRTYADFSGFIIDEFDYDKACGRIDMALVANSQDVAAIIVQNPNFFGIIEDAGDMAELSEVAHNMGALFIMCCDPISLGLLKPPGCLGADVAVGEGQALGNGMSFGGPYLGFIAVKKHLMRMMPGRIVGQTTDMEGKRAFVLTLQAREQHIRREKATSNICSNQSLNALAAAVYLAILGKNGLRDTAALCLRNARYTCDGLIRTGYFKPCFTLGNPNLVPTHSLTPVPVFKEFVLECPISPDKLNAALFRRGFIGGLDLRGYYPELGNSWLVAVTEKRSREEMDAFITAVAEIVAAEA